MGFHIDSIHSLPVGKLDYFIYVVESRESGHAKWVSEHLTELVGDLSENTGLVTGPAELTKEIRAFLEKYLDKVSFHAIRDLLDQTTCLLVSKGHLLHTAKPIHLIPLAAAAAHGSNLQNANDVHEFIPLLLREISKRLAGDDLDSLKTYEFKLAPTGGFIVCMIRDLNELVVLRPTLFGVGADLNKVIKRFLPEERAI